ncbi:Hypothetical protein FKW44_021151, partial [Caligus rogercresseyi]
MSQHSKSSAKSDKQDGAVSFKLLHRHAKICFRYLEELFAGYRITWQLIMFKKVIE